MSTTITLDDAGRFVLPQAILDRLKLHKGSRLKVNVVSDHLELSPEGEENIQVVSKGKRLVITGVKRPFDAVAEIKAAREERGL